MDVRHHVRSQPAGVDLMSYGPLLGRYASVGPGIGVQGIHAIQLDTTVVDQVTDGIQHAVVLEVPGAAGLTGKCQHRAAVVAILDDGHAPVDAAAQWQFELMPVHLTISLSPDTGLVSYRAQGRGELQSVAPQLYFGQFVDHLP